MKPKILIILTVAVVLITAIVIILINYSKSPPPLSISESNQSYTTAKQERKLVALGASMTKANNLSSEMIGDNEEYSFVTGAKINSFY